MIGENIKKFRIVNGLTQKDLADKLFVTAQAVSRWENGEVEPSISTVNEMAKIFNISVDELLGNGVEKTEPQVVTETKYVYQEQKPVLGVCEICNKPIYDGEDIVRKTRAKSTQVTISCRSCEEERLQKEKEAKVAKSISRRKKAFWIGGIVAVLWLAVAIITAIEEKDASIALYNGACAIIAFTFISCCLFANNFVGDVTWNIIEWGFVRMPGLIFSLDLDGIIWLLTVKLFFWILQFIISILMGLLAIVVGGILSVFVYPFALRKNIVHPELIEL